MVPCVAVGCCYLWMLVFPRECFGLWCVVLLSMLVFSLVVALSTFGQRTVRRYNNTHCTYRVNLQHEGSISELHCAKSFFLAPARTVQFFWQRIIVPCISTGIRLSLFSLSLSLCRKKVPVRAAIKIMLQGVTRRRRERERERE
jgi:hypothetical protein